MVQDSNHHAGCKPAQGALLAITGVIRPRSAEPTRSPAVGSRKRCLAGESVLIAPVEYAHVELSAVQYHLHPYGVRPHRWPFST
jgi:hypothetical protein